jgi:hypothetical protein
VGIVCDLARAETRPVCCPSDGKRATSSRAKKRLLANGTCLDFYLGERHLSGLRRQRTPPQNGTAALVLNCLGRSAGIRAAMWVRNTTAKTGNLQR